MKTLLKVTLAFLATLLAVTSSQAQLPAGPPGDDNIDNYLHIYDGFVQEGLYYIDGVVDTSGLIAKTFSGVKYFSVPATFAADHTVKSVWLAQHHVKKVNSICNGFTKAAQFKITLTANGGVYSIEMKPADIKPDGTVVVSRQGDELTPEERKDMEKRRKKELRKSNRGNKGYGDRTGVSTPANQNRLAQGNSASGQPQGNPASQQRQKRPIRWSVGGIGGVRTPYGDVIVNPTVGNNGDGTGTYFNVNTAAQNEWGIVGGSVGNGGIMQGQGMPMNGGVMMNGGMPNGQFPPNNTPPVFMGGCANCVSVYE